MPTPSQSIDVFVVDDHPVTLRAVEGLVRDSGHRVAGRAASTTGTLATLARRRADVVVVDPDLPDGDGRELIRSLLARTPPLPAVVFAGRDDEAARRVARAWGARGFVSKSSDPAELMAAIEAVAAGGERVDWCQGRPDTASAVSARPRSLTPQQREVLTLFARGLTREDIAAHLGLSVETVRTHARNATERMLARNRIHAIALAIASGEIAPEASPL